MPDLILSDGIEITIDLNAITLREWLGMFNENESDSRSDITIAKACHMPYEEFIEIKFDDYLRIISKFFEKSREPIKNPN